MAEDSVASIHVLVVDDDEVMRELLSALLEAEGHRVVAVEASARALNILEAGTETFDVVLTDLRMSDTDATDSLKRLRAASGSGVKLIGMSGSAAEPAELKLLDGFLLKPFTVEEFMAAVDGAKKPDDDGDAGRVNVPVLDPITFQHMAGSLPTATLRELYNLTLADVQKRSEAIRTAAAAGDTATCKSEAHAMKGGCGMVGAMELRAVAADIEAGAPVDTPLLNEIAAAVERLRRMLNTLT